jgi:GGDEF domain-containing protein
MTASIAIGFWPDDDDNWQRLADRTNEAMQHIWKKGGNRVTLLREVSL